jgi:uncharacterized protein YjbI with pentapeptide repeats
VARSSALGYIIAFITSDQGSIVLSQGFGGASMANDEHVALLKQGVAAWNAWRCENPEVRVDLSRMNVDSEDLMDLSEANLRSANLWEANLNSANLRGADLFWAKLQGGQPARPAYFRDSPLNELARSKPSDVMSRYSTSA